jgi:hypothetical protein
MWWSNFISIFKPLLSFLRSTYSESDGSGSSTRVHIAALLSFVIGVGVSFSVMVHHKVITIEQFDSFLSAGGTFLVTSCGALYGINKLSSWAENKQNPPGSQPPQ